MGRIFTVLLVFSVAINPGFQARAQPHVQWLLDPVYERLVRMRVNEITRALEAEASLGRPLPAGPALATWLRRHYRQEGAAMDPWNTPFYLVRDLWTVRVASAGPDHRAHTADDIVSTPIRQAEP